MTDSSLDAVLRSLDQPESPSRSIHRTIAPVSRPVSPGSARAVPSTGAPMRLPEGTFIPPTRGTPIRSEIGEWLIVFHPDEDGKTLGPMVLMPSAAMERIEETVTSAEAGENPAVVVSGQVFVYHNQSYLLPSTSAAAVTAEAGGDTGSGDAKNGAPSSARAEDEEAPPDNSSRDVLDLDDPSVTEILRQLESHGTRQRALEAASRMSGTQRAADGVEEAPVDEMVFRRTGRVVRDSGVWMFRPDNDPDSADQAAMVLMPCLNLMRIEHLAASRGPTIRFVMSGRTLSYKGVRFLLPTLYQVERDSELDPLQ